MNDPHGPGEPFVALFDEQREGEPLPDAFTRIYGAWPLPEPGDRPFTFVNFVMSMDGRVSFDEPGHYGGGDVSRRDQHDRWLMGLIRSRADAVLVGGSSIEKAGRHVWTPQAVYPEDADAWAALREREGRAPAPLLVVLTRSGDVPRSAPALDDPDLAVLLATTSTGAQEARRRLGERAWVRYLDMGAAIDQPALMRALRRDWEIEHLLVEGGPQIYGSLLRDGLIDDAFLTISPIVMGEDADHRRPSLIEGVAFGWDAPPQVRLLSAHRHGSYLYLHARYE